MPPEGREAVPVVVRRAPSVADRGVPVAVGAVVRPRVTSPVTGVPVEGMTRRLPAVGVPRSPAEGVAPCAASAARRRPLMVGNTVAAPFEVPVGRRASSVPVPPRGVLAATGVDALLVRRRAVAAGAVLPADT